MEHSHASLNPSAPWTPAVLEILCTRIQQEAPSLQITQVISTGPRPSVLVHDRAHGNLPLGFATLDAFECYLQVIAPLPAHALVPAGGAA